MTRSSQTPAVYLLLGLTAQGIALANFFNGHLFYAALLSLTGSWFVGMAVAAFWYARKPEDFSEKIRLLLGDVTIGIGSIVALGIVGFEQQLSSSFLPLYLFLVGTWIYRRHRPGYRAWQALG